MQNIVALSKLIAIYVKSAAKYGSDVPIVVQFMSLKGKFQKVKEQKFRSLKEALEAVKEYAAHHGFTDVKIAEDSDMDRFRFTAKTPGGRGGRNIAFGDYDYTDEPIYESDHESYEEDIEQQKADRHPILNSLITNGTIRIDGSEYVGIAADGTEVSIGNVGDDDQVEKYLESHPTPDTW